MRLLLLAALLVGTPLSTAQHVNFYRMSSNGCATGVKSDTGYSAPVIKYVWRKYRAQLINAARGYEGFRFVVNEGDDALAEYVGLCLYAALWYMHIYPTVAAIGGWEFGRRTKRYFSKSEFYACVMPIIVELALIIDEVDYADRLHPRNHGTGILYRRFTALIDCAPIFVRDPTDSFWSSLLFQGKYNGAVFKIQVAINFLGWIVLYTGLHAGTRTDDEIFHDTAAQHPFEWWELWLGDGAYESCLGCVTGYAQRAAQALGVEDVWFNSYINHYRQRVEHTMHLLKDHGMWRCIHARNSPLVLDACMKLTVHLTNVGIKEPWMPSPCARYPGWGNHPHYP